jgi:hypothetical protein
MASVVVPRRALPTFMDEAGRVLACTQRPDLFVSFNDRGNARTRRVRHAAALCEDCPVKAACLAWAVKYGQDGVFGGKLVSRGRVLQ